MRMILPARPASARSTLVDHPLNFLVTPDSIGMHINIALGPNLPIPYGIARAHSYTKAGKFVNWRDIEVTNNNPVWGAIDEWVDFHERGGRKMIIDLSGTPDWTVAGAAAGGADAYGGKSNMPPDNNSDWTDFVSQFAARFTGRGLIYDGWNEPNLTKYWRGATATPTRLATLHRLLYQTVKAADPSATVLSPSFTSVFSGVDGATGETGTGLKQFLAASDGASGTGAQWFDHLSYHFYSNDSALRPTGLERMWRGIQDQLKIAGRSSADVWCTETGMIDPAFGTIEPSYREGLMRAYMYSLFALGCKKVLWFSFDESVIGFGTNAGLAARTARVWTEIYNNLVGARLLGGKIWTNHQREYNVELTTDRGVLFERVQGMPL